jgi:DNA polymerase I-like protein with 3'-5' exonuclease and polymerase domains
LLAERASKKAARTGFIKTILGRRCRFPEDPQTGRYDWTHKALNRLIQGSSADQTKKAMVELDDVGYYLQLQVHDEIDSTVETVKIAKEMAEIMKTCVPLQVPSKVDVEVGPSWGEIK